MEIKKRQNNSHWSPKKNCWFQCLYKTKCYHIFLWIKFTEKWVFWASFLLPKKFTHLWPFSKSKFHLKSDRFNLASPSDLFTQCPGDTVQTGTGKKKRHKNCLWFPKKKCWFHECLYKTKCYHIYIYKIDGQSVFWASLLHLPKKLSLFLIPKHLRNPNNLGLKY